MTINFVPYIWEWFAIRAGNQPQLKLPPLEKMVPDTKLDLDFMSGLFICLFVLNGHSLLRYVESAPINSASLKAICPKLYEYLVHFTVRLFIYYSI